MTLKEAADEYAGTERWYEYGDNHPHQLIEYDSFIAGARWAIEEAAKIAYLAERDRHLWAHEAITIGTSRKLKTMFDVALEIKALGWEEEK